MDDHVRLEFLINMDFLDRTGSWGCIYRGKRSTSVVLEPKRYKQPVENTESPNLTKDSTGRQTESNIIPAALLESGSSLGNFFYCFIISCISLLCILLFS